MKMALDNYRKWRVVVLTSRSSCMAFTVEATAWRPLRARIKLDMVADEIERNPYNCVSCSLQLFRKYSVLFAE